jgi:hypothetical protein
MYNFSFSLEEAPVEITTVPEAVPEAIELLLLKLMKLYHVQLIA